MRICRMMVTLAVFTLSFLGLTANGDEVSGVEQAECGVGRIALFKNGLAYFQSSVAVPEGVSEFQFWPEGSAAHGTFWLSWPSNLAALLYPLL
ncbi:MAG: hypothetical protein JW936_11405, partial [Sedimentisphaerales bacterium]|nr:hypothetical protein [Sedimentisphaerales bacterium]